MRVAKVDISISRRSSEYRTIFFLLRRDVYTIFIFKGVIKMCRFSAKAKMEAAKTDDMFIAVIYVYVQCAGNKY